EPNPIESRLHQTVHHSPLRRGSLIFARSLESLVNWRRCAARQKFDEPYVLQHQQVHPSPGKLTASKSDPGNAHHQISFTSPSLGKKGVPSAPNNPSSLDWR